ncbi:MAG: carboxymuconolactone decarboxylase family protein [Planctomycetaceae bacterium]
MSRISQIVPESATGKARELLDAVKGKLGLVPNMTRAMANAPAALDGYLSLSGALGKGLLSAKDRERIALAVGQANGCDYCLAAHSTIGKMVGLTDDQILDSRRGTADDSKSAAIVQFAGQVVMKQGRVTDADLADARVAGLDDAAIAEVVANIALNIFTNYFNHVAETDIDFPTAEPLVDHHDVCATIPGCDETR